MLYQALTSWGGVCPQKGGNPSPQGWAAEYPSGATGGDYLRVAGPKDGECLWGAACGADHRPAWGRGHTAPAAWDREPVSAQRDIASALSIGRLPGWVPCQDSDYKGWVLVQGSGACHLSPEGAACSQEKRGTSREV